MEFIFQPWPWYVSGPLLAGIMLLLVYFGKTFGMSSNLKTFCTLAGAGKRINFFKEDWRSQRWNLTVVLGAVIGGFLSSQFLSDGSLMELSPQTVQDLSAFGFTQIGESLVPPELYGWDHILNLKGISLLILAGFLIGFGTRYAGGCTSGHAITGLSNLQLPSLIAVIGFFIGGLIITFLFLPLIL